MTNTDQQQPGDRAAPAGDGAAPTGGDRAGMRRRALGDVARGAGVGLIGRVVRNGVQFAFAVLAARWLGAEVFGLWLLAFGVATLAAQAAKLGLDRGVVAIVARHRGAGDLAAARRTAWSSLALTLLIAAAIALVLEAAAGAIGARVLDKPAVVPFLRVMLLAVPLHATMLVALGATRGYKTMGPTVAAEEMTQPLALLALFVAFMVAGRPAVWAAWAQVLSIAAGTLVAVALMWRIVGRRGHAAAAAGPAAAATASAAAPAGPVAAARPWRALLATSLPLALVAISGRLYAWLSTLILGAWARAESVAVFQAGLRVTFLLLFVTLPINQMFAPVIAEVHAAGRREEVAELLAATTRWVLAAGLPLAVVFAAFGSDWMALFGEEFRRGAPVLAVLGLATLLNACTGPVFWLLQMARREIPALVASLVFVIAQAALTLALAPGLGALGAAIATLGSVIAFAAVAVAVCRRDLGSWPIGREVAKPLVATVVAAVPAAALAALLPAAHGAWSIARLAFGCAVTGVVYGIVLLRLGLEADDRHLLARAPIPLVRRLIERLAR